MDVLEIGPGLWRWTAYHDEWKEDVGCVYCETEDGTVLIDPLIPPEDSPRFLETLDREVAGHEVHILVTIFWHTRSTASLHERYGGRVWAPSSARAAVTRRSEVVTDAFKAGDRLPGGLEAFRTARSTEVVYWIPRHAALVPGDVLLGDGSGGLRMCPESWLPEKTGHRELAESLRPLGTLAIESVLVSHGEPVLRQGGKALAAALARA